MSSSSKDESAESSTGKGDALKGASAHVATTNTVVAAMSFYMVVSIALVFANKSVLSGQRLDAPLFLTWTQLVVAVGACWLIALIKPLLQPSLNFFPAFEYRVERAKAVLPLSLIFIGMVVFNNLCLKYVEVSFYQVARSLTIMANIALTYLVLGKSTSTMALLGCAVVVFGFVLGTIGELGAINASFRGVLFGVTSSAFVALYAIYVKKVLPAVNDDSWLLMIYNNINAALIMPVCFVLLGELAPIAASEALFEPDYWLTLLVAGMLGFLINIATFFQIQVTSPLTHNVVGTFKAAVQTVFAVVYYQNSTTIWFWLGFILTLVGSMIYFAARN